MARPIQSRHTEIKKAANAFDNWARFQRSRRSAFADMVHSWTIALRNQHEPRDEEWRAREAEYAKLESDAQPDGIEIYAQCLAAIATVSQRERGDHLGELYQSISANSTSSGQFFTPYSASQLTAAFTMSQESVAQKIAEKGFVTIYEPTSGSGGMLITAAERLLALGYDTTTTLRAYASDIDRICVDMTYIQSMLQGVPCWVQQADALDPHSGDRYLYRLATPSFIDQLEREIAQVA